jgi:hypothetical protein
MTDATFTPPPPPDPVKVAQWAGQIRSFLSLIGGVLAGVGIVLPSFTDTQINGYVYATMTIVGLVSYGVAAYKSWQAKNADRKALVASAKASAQHGTAVVVTETPPGQENVAVKISATEQAAAPSVPQGVPPQPAPMVP